MVGHELEQLFPERPAGRDEVVLEVRGVRRLPDLKDATFELRAGEVLGIAGLVGAGRSELLRAIHGVDRRDDGEVVVDGRILPPNRPDLAIAAGLGFAPEDRKSQALLLEWNLTKNVSLADLARFQRILLRVRAERAAAEEQLRLLRTTPSDGDRIVRHCRRNQQKVVRRAGCSDAAASLLDEPTRGVDVETSELFRIIAGLAEQGLGVIVVSSEIESSPAVHPPADHARGQIVAEMDAAPRPAKCCAAMPGTRRSSRGGTDPRRDRTSTQEPFMTTTRHVRRANVGREAADRASLVGARLQEFALAGVIVLLVVIGAILKPATF
jgi:ribose transport system ATP-binding protein